MKIWISILCVSLLVFLASCDLRSGIAKKEMEKYETKPEPPPAAPPAPLPSPVEPEDVVEVDTTLQGDPIGIDGYNQKTAAACTKFNRVMVNGGNNVLMIKGICRQITINGDSNQITADGAMEFVFNGSNNVLRYSRFPNGKRPTVIENQQGNTIEKVSKLQSNKKVK